MIASKSLELVIFVGLILPILANNNEQKTELEQQAADSRIKTVIITGGPGISSVGADLLDHSARVRAVKIGFADGGRAVPTVKDLVNG